ncbi:hypothetical protein VFPFJ_04362 [Purpureocillium lilacinum]|uniref:Uncharacterized protein n=1 Tax=Purpureocillium lilacinum TaxID=33203 RepID=A0A179HLF4_PURLI|nr:hypothetical protein VFPFJ_04362 [Purpureocillium lilacinum]OAQ90203.1 hypothetical protein VFPFJ_04362 [Purpureocillium lilacinum]
MAEGTRGCDSYLALARLAVSTSRLKTTHDTRVTDDAHLRTSAGGAVTVASHSDINPRAGLESH